jgi:DNA-binding MarR family transcriptional regulator
MVVEQAQRLGRRNGCHTAHVTPPSTPNVDDPDRQADAVIRASRVLVGVVAKSVAEVEDRVSLTQFRVLVLVAGRGRMNLGQVAEALGVHPSNATRTVERLVVAGLLERAEHPQDRRYLTLELTGEGRAVVEQVMAYRRASILDVMANMSGAQRRALARALETFAAAAGEPAQGEEGYLLGLPT